MSHISKPALAICVGLVLTLALGASAALAQSTGAVTISDFQFTPASMQVTQGATLTWTNNGPSSHTTTADNGAWDSGTLAPGKSFSFKFNTPGTFSYHCTIHPNMKGTITVSAAAAAPAASTSTVTSPSPSAGAAAPSSRPSASTAPAQLPKTGGGGPNGPAGLPIIAGLLGLSVLSAGAWRRYRTSKQERRTP